jgi:hypothetical protein
MSATKLLYKWWDSQQLDHYTTNGGSCHGRGHPW